MTRVQYSLVMIIKYVNLIRILLQYFILSVIDIPSFEYLESLKSSEKSFEPYQATTTDGNFTALVIHFTPTEILYSDKYQEFIRKFSDSTHHLVVNDCNSFSGYYASHKVQWQLNQLNEYVFPLLRFLFYFLYSK